MDGSARAFVYEPAAQRVIFGNATIGRLREEVERLDFRRVLVLTTKEQAGDGEQVAALLGDRFAAKFSEAAMHTPVEVTERACSLAAQEGVDGIVAIGGGSTIGLAKAMTLRIDVPQVAIPTTYAGSEMTDLIGQTANGEKVTERSAKIRPRTVIYDVDLTLGLRPLSSVLSGLNAAAHAAEALYAPDSNPVVALMAEEGLRALATALPAILEDPKASMSRSDALYGAWLCGSCLGSATMGLHHKLCHVLGGSLGLPHAEMHSVLLPYSLAFNAEAAPAATAAMSRAFGGRDPGDAIRGLLTAAGASLSLGELGMTSDGIEPTVEKIVSATFANPRRVTAGPLRAMLTSALEGRTPHTHEFQ